MAGSRSVQNPLRLFSVCGALLLVATFPVSAVPLLLPYLSFVLACNSHDDLGTVVANPLLPSCLLTARRLQKFRGLKACRAVLCEPSVSALGQSAQIYRERLFRFDRGLIVSLGSPARYCASKARSAAAMLGPIPTIPFSIFGPSSAIQRSLRTNSLGRRISEGLFGWAAR